MVELHASAISRHGIDVEQPSNEADHFRDRNDPLKADPYAAPIGNYVAGYARVPD